MNKPKLNYTAKTMPMKDRCQTPAYALDPLLPYIEQFKEGNIWESACGEGYLADALELSLFVTYASDILTGYDYFNCEPPIVWDCMVTNPPFSLKYKWLARAYDLGKPFALLMPVDTLAAKTAQALFEKHGVEIILMDKRVDFKMPNKGWDGAAQFASAWFTWKLNIGTTITYAKLNKTKNGGHAE